MGNRPPRPRPGLKRHATGTNIGLLGHALKPGCKEVSGLIRACPFRVTKFQLLIKLRQSPSKT